MKSKIRPNTLVPSRRRRILIALGFVAALAAAGGLYVGCNRARTACLEPCVITDVTRQVCVASGKMVKADVLARELGLTNGANLALIDYDARRRAVLRRIPTLREIRISRRLPDKVDVVAEERSPIAQLSYVGRKAPTGHVVDADGMVFVCQRGTLTLPLIREPAGLTTKPGCVLSGRARAAIQMIEACRDPAFQELHVQEIDVTKPDYLMVTLGNYSRAKVAWTGMGETTVGSGRSLTRQLTMLTQAMRCHVSDGVVIWNATDTTSPGRIYADIRGNL